MLPLTKFTGHLKSIRFKDLEEGERQVIDLAFPGFRPLKGPTPEMLEQVRAFEKRKIKWFFDMDNPRRFAGDSLGPNRYYSVAQDEEGDDGGCLRNELRAYRKPQMTRVYVADSGLAADRTQLASLLPFQPRQKHIYVQFDFVRFRGLMPKSSRIEGESSSGGLMLLYWVPYNTSQETIGDVIDLRIPETRAWFCETFKKGPDEMYRKPLGQINSFYEMLPTLMDPEIGGGHITQAGITHHLIGNWLRLQGVAALIYPSARSDVAVKLEHGAITEFVGWNLVDYRGAEKPNSAGALDVDKWIPGFPDSRIHISIPNPTEEALIGSFQVRGVTEFLERHYQDEVTKSRQSQGIWMKLKDILSSLARVFTERGQRWQK